MRRWSAVVAVTRSENHALTIVLCQGTFHHGRREGIFEVRCADGTKLRQTFRMDRLVSKVKRKRDKIPLQQFDEAERVQNAVHAHGVESPAYKGSDDSMYVELPNATAVQSDAVQSAVVATIGTPIPLADTQLQELQNEQGASADLCGGGGCTAFSLEKLDVFPTEEVACTALNNAAEKIYQQRCKRHGSSYARDKVYKPGLTWCHEAMQVAIQSQKYRFMKILTADEVLSGNTDVSLEELVKTDACLLMEGTLASVYRPVGARDMVHTDPDDPSTHIDNPDGWCHTIAMKAGLILDTFNPDGIPVATLYLANNTLGEDAYMYRISKVWQVTKLTLNKRVASTVAGKRRNTPKASQSGKPKRVKMKVCE
eukprot:COSAG06_NODE_461_length_15416_cov_516.842854_4_plen_369_part_00